MSLEEILAITDEEEFDVTLSGGDPLFNPEATAKLVKALKKNRRNIWIYTGYTWEEIISSPTLLKAIEEADVVVEGRFDLSLKDTDLRFKGSSNQRIIKIKDSIENDKIILY